MTENKKEIQKRITGIIYVVCVIVSIICFFTMLYKEIVWSDAYDDILGSSGTAFFAIIVYGPVFIIEYAVFRLIRLFVFNEIILSEKVKFARNVFLCVSWSFIFLMGLICRCIWHAIGFQQIVFLRDYVYFEIALGMIIVFVPAYILGFVLDKIIRFLCRK